MSERKPLSKNLRFEVFKRDSSTCQHCASRSWWEWNRAMDNAVCFRIQEVS